LVVVGVADLSGDLSWLTDAERRGYFITGDLSKIVLLSGLKVVVNAAADRSIALQLKRELSPGVELIDVRPDSFTAALLRFKEQLLETRRLKGELWAVLNSVQDAIEVADSSGVIKYVNPAFTRVTGIPAEKRVQRNIFEASPQGALAQSLIVQKPVTGYRTRVGGSDVEVISNASPIIVDGEITGAVVVFQPVSDILKLMDQLKHSSTIIENLYAQIDQISGSRWSFDEMVGQSKVFRATIEMARKSARGDAPILLSGEGGTGKSAFAHAIHNYSPRKRRPLIIYDCSVVPESLQEQALFGCEKDALPGVVRTTMGKAELAGEGTLFIKEINSLKPFLQEKLFYLLQEGHFKRIGGDEPIPADFRLIASANGVIKAEVQKGYFSEKLYRQLSMVEIALPPLRKRQEDLPVLVQQMIVRLNRKLNKRIVEISPRALQEMAEYDWPGNLSELKNVLERSLAVADGSVIEYHHLAPYIGKTGSSQVAPFEEIMPLDKLEQMMLKLALARYGETLEGKKKAAQALNISLATLYNKLKKYNGW